MSSIISEEGWFVLHLYYSVDRRLWSSVSSEDRLQIPEALKSFADSFRRMENCQIQLYSIWGHKADMGVLMIDPDLDRLNEFENRLASTFPPGLLKPVYSFVSMTEISDYISQDKDFDRTLREKEGLLPDSELYQQKMAAFKSRIQGYIDSRLHPRLPDEQGP
jgi:peroxiredoxin